MDGLGPLFGSRARQVILRARRSVAEEEAIVQAEAPSLRWRAGGEWEDVWLVGSLERLRDLVVRRRAP